MVGFTNVLLCVTEDDDAAVRYVARLAAATSADLTIADVIEDVPPIARRLLPRSWNLPALVRTRKQARIERSAALRLSLPRAPGGSLAPDPESAACWRTVGPTPHAEHEVDAMNQPSLRVLVRSWIPRQAKHDHSRRIVRLRSWYSGM